jgi:hypothetical protein
VGYHVIGWSFAVGFGALLGLFVPLQLWLSRRFAMLRSLVAALADKRIVLMGQAVAGVRVLRMSGWEDNFEGRIAEVRRWECAQLGRVDRYRALNEAVFFVCSAITTALIFVVHVLGRGGADSAARLLHGRPDQSGAGGDWRRPSTCPSRSCPCQSAGCQSPGSSGSRRRRSSRRGAPCRSEGRGRCGDGGIGSDVS